MEKIVFADTFTKTFKNVMKIPSVIVDDPIFRLHYRFTGLVLLFSSIMVSAYQLFGEPILCIQKDDIPESLLNTYCWIEGTFTLPKALSKKVGTEIVYPGVETYNDGDEIVEHAFYQWVCFVLFLQAVMFCVPYFMWRTLESGRMKALIQKLGDPLLESNARESCYNSLNCYFKLRKDEHNHYALKYLFCECLNFINVLGQIYFIDRFLGGEFRNYGVNVVRYVNEEQQNRIDPMIRVFPRITKCTFHKFGSSGTIQKHDALCLLPLNILNEKIFVVMWFWFVILAILSGVLLVYRVVIFMSKKAQAVLLKCVASLMSEKEISPLIRKYSYGDWFLLYLLADNIDNLHFRQFLLQLRPDCKSEKEDSIEKEEDISFIKTGKIDEVDKSAKESEHEALLGNNESSV